MEIFERILELVETKGITPYEISSKTGISEAVLSRLLNGKTKKPNQNNIKTLAKYFNISEDWLRTGVGVKGVFEVGSISGNNNTSIAGNGNKVNADTNICKLINEVAEQRKMTVKSQEQIDRLLALLENQTLK